MSSPWTTYNSGAGPTSGGQNYDRGQRSSTPQPVGGQEFWDGNRRRASATRWHPQYSNDSPSSNINTIGNNSNNRMRRPAPQPPSPNGTPGALLTPTTNSSRRFSYSPSFSTLEPIAEDSAHHHDRRGSSPHQRYNNADLRRPSPVGFNAEPPGGRGSINGLSHASSFTNNESSSHHGDLTARRHSEGDLLELSTKGRYKKSSIPNSRRSSRGDQGGEGARLPRRKSSTGLDSVPDIDAYSEVSEKSRQSVLSDESLQSAGQLARKGVRRADGDGSSFRKVASSESIEGMDKKRRKSSTVSAAASVADSERRSSVATGIESVKSGRSQRRMSTLSLTDNAASPFASLEIPIELLEAQTSRVRKLLGPIIMFLLVVTLLASLIAAVYFAVVLKGAQEQQIEFLQATLKFALSRDTTSRDFSQLTSAEKMELKLSYCRQVDALYKTSSLQSGYRGCEVDVLTNDRIEFKLYFIDDEQQSRGEDEILQVLEQRAAHVSGSEGAELRKINDVTLNISETSRDVNVVVTRKPENFYGADSVELKIQETAKENADTDGKNNVILRTTKQPQIVTKSILTTTMLKTSSSSTTTTTTTNITAVRETTTEEPETVLSKEICTKIRPAEIIAHPTDCTHYIQCEFGNPISRPCSGGLVFDPDKRVCSLPDPNLPCTKVEPCKNINGGHFPHPDNCRFYIMCDQGKTIVQSCSDSLIWDIKSKNCVPRKRGTECEPAIT